MPILETTVRRKSRWRTQNTRRALKFARMRAAKERIRRDRAAREEPAPDFSHVTMPAMKRPMFSVRIRCRDGAEATINACESPFRAGGTFPSATLVGRKVEAVLQHYRPERKIFP